MKEIFSIKTNFVVLVFNSQVVSNSSNGKVKIIIDELLNTDKQRAFEED